MARLVHLGVLGDVAVVQVGGERDEALGREPVAHLLDLRDDAPPLLHDEDTGPRARCRDREVALRGVAVARERDRLSHAPEPKTVIVPEPGAPRD